MIDKASLVGKFFTPYDHGTLIADFSGSAPELWIETRWGLYRLLPRETRAAPQLFLPLGLITNIEDLADRLEIIFYRTLNAIECFKEGKRELLDYCLSYGIQAVELTENCPALAYLAAMDHYFQRRLKSFGELSHQPSLKRTQILKSSQFLESKWVVKLFQKIPVTECCNSLFHDLRGILSSTNPRTHKALQHIDRLNKLTVKTLADEKFFQLIHQPFLFRLSHIPEDDSSVDIFWEIYAIRDELLQAISQGLRAPQIRCFDDLHNVHDNLIEWLNDQDYLLDVEDIIFPTPPLLPRLISQNYGRCFGIFPITSGKDLWLEGQQMHHCIAGYAFQIEQEKGKLYAYHVELPGEVAATLLVRKNLSGWVIQEIRGPCNEDVSKKVLAFVHQWLEQKNGTYYRRRHLSKNF